jgi:hypothetical protein
MKRALPLLTLTALVGCSGATTAFTRTGPTLPAQPDSCDFAVATSRPTEPYTELGTIDIKYSTQTDWIYDESAFKRKVRPLVCQSGGDTAVAHLNDNGLYTKATVLTTKPIPKAPEKEAAPPESAAQAVDSVAEPAAAAKPPPTPAPAAEKSAPAEPAKKEESSKKEASAAKDEASKKGGKKGASAKKEEDIRGKDGKIDIDKLL